ncbi:MAG TPA: GNAT family N-acetyltransferase [Bryobacteraceae bacterium]
MKAALKKLYFRIAGKDPEAIVVSFATGERDLAERMSAEIQRLEPERKHVLVQPDDFGTASAWRIYRTLHSRFRRCRIGLAPVLLGDPRYRSLRRAAFLLAPRKLLAYNQRLERHHLRMRTALASFLFIRGVPVDRIFLRPRWLMPWKRDRSVYPSEVVELEGRAMSPRRRSIAVLTPYFPYPLSHGGAVRIFNLLREMAAQFDVFLFSFLDRETEQDFQPVLEHCARLILVKKARYREPRWSTLEPPEVHEFRSPAMLSAIERIRREHNVEALQVEYTMLAPYRGDILVEHDVTFDLYGQIDQTSWDYRRWRRFEKKWVARYRKVVVMSGRDQKLLRAAHTVVIPNGVDLQRFAPEIERPGQRLLFVGSFRHFPNIVAYRFFTEQVWPKLRDRLPEIRITVIAGPDPAIYWREQTGLTAIPQDDRIQLLEFVSDVRPFYVEANLVLVPTLVSAGTNLKVLEAMAMERAVLSTSSGCGGLELEHMRDVWIADRPDDFAQGIETLLSDGDLRARIASAGRAHAEQNFDWKKIGERQRNLLHETLPSRAQMRPAQKSDIPEITAIQSTANEAAQWQASDYLTYDCQVAVLNGRIAGFLVSRGVAANEREILNIAVHPDFRRLRIATDLLRFEISRRPGAHFLEVRESNTPARRLYEQLGFQAVGSRPGYYDDPPEAAIVMRVFS